MQWWKETALRRKKKFVSKQQQHPNGKGKKAAASKKPWQRNTVLHTEMRAYEIHCGNFGWWKELNGKHYRCYCYAFALSMGNGCVIIIASGKHSASRHTMVGARPFFSLDLCVSVLLKFNTDILVSELPYSHICLPHCRHRRRRCRSYRTFVLVIIRFRTKGFWQMNIPVCSFHLAMPNVELPVDGTVGVSFSGILFGLERNGQIMSNSFDAKPVTHGNTCSKMLIWSMDWRAVPSRAFSSHLLHYIWMHMNSELPIYFLDALIPCTPFRCIPPTADTPCLCVNDIFINYFDFISVWPEPNANGAPFSHRHSMTGFFLSTHPNASVW